MTRDFHLVVRCAGERTQSVATRLASRQLRSASDISIVSEVPFEAALRATCEAGYRAGKQWTITLDADVLLKHDAVERLLDHAEQMPSHFLELEGLVYDKVIGVYRQAGHRVYRTELLPRFLARIPPAGTQIRPESHVVKELGRLGHPARYVACIVGLHDYEQRYCDLYRKAMVHAKKWSHLISPLIQRSAQNMHDDTDFLVILKGLWDGLTIQHPLAIDRRLFTESAPEALRSLGLEEKSEIEDANGFVTRFEAMFENITSRNPATDATIMDKPKQSDPEEPQAAAERWIGKIRDRISRQGLARGSVASLGALLRRLGQNLDRR